MDDIEYCSVCDRELETEKGDAFLTDDGVIWCNDHYPMADPEDDPQYATA